MNFLFSENLLWLWILPLLAIVLVYAHIRVKKVLFIFAEQRIFDLIGEKLSSSRVFIKGTLLLLSFFLMIFAMARPRWGYEWKEVQKGGVDLMIVLDLSASMMAQDISPNRLERAKREILDLMKMLEGDRIGIVAFAGVSYVSCPLTSDYRLASLFLDQLSIDKIPVQGTDISGAVLRAAKSLEKSSGANNEGKAIILMTDGEDNENSPDSLIQKLKKLEIKVFSIGIGGVDGAPIPDPSGGFKKDEKGQVILSKLDEHYLQKLSLETGGSYIRSTSGDMDLDFIYKKGIRKNSKEGDYGKEKQKIWYERYQWFLFLAFLLLMFEFFIREYKKES